MKSRIKIRKRSLILLSLLSVALTVALAATWLLHREDVDIVLLHELGRGH